MKPYLSVVLPTMRPGGMDILFSSLEKQAFKDYELIIVDKLYEYRKNVVAEKAKQYPSVHYTHMSSPADQWPTQSYCRAINSGIVHVKGEVIVFITDYRYFMPDMLQLHAEFHKLNPDNYGLGGGTRFVFPPKLKDGTPEYGLNYKQFIEGLKNNKLQNCMWSIFENEFDINTHDPSNLEEHDPAKLGWDPKIYSFTGMEVNPMHIFLQNDSVKTKIVLEANGMNELLEAHRGPPDIEFSHRLRNLFGFKWYGDNRSITYRITGGERVIYKMKLADNQDELRSVFEKYRDGSKDPVNDWSLLDAYTVNNK